MKIIKSFSLLVIVILLSACAITTSENMFDEFYYTYVEPNLVDTEFINVSSLSQNTFQVSKDMIGSERGYEFYLTYDKDLKENSYLRENTRAYAVIDPERKEVTWYCTVNCSDAVNDPVYGNDEELCFEYQYDVGSRTFVIRPVQAGSKKLAEKYPDKYLQTEAYGNAEYIDAFCELHNISKQDISEYAHYFFDEVIVGLWIDGNRDASKYTIDNLGNCNIIDDLLGSGLQ